MTRGATLSAPWLHKPQPISNHPVGLGFPHPSGWYRPGGSAFSYPGSWSGRYKEGFLTRGWKLIPSTGRGRTSALARGAALAARWLHDSQPVSNHPVGLGFPRLAGRYRPEGSAFSFPGSWSFRDMDGFVNRGWQLFLPGCGGTSALARGATLAARWFHELQPMSNHQVGLGFPRPAEWY